jgi:hypothetical protein
MDRLGRAWTLYCDSFALLSREKSIILFPVLSAIAAVLLAAAFFVPVYQVGILKDIAARRATWVDWIPLVSWYFANTFVVVFFNSALVACADIRLRGGDPTVADGLRIAASRIHRIAAWTVLASTVGLVLRSIEESSERAGRIATSLLGTAWTAVTYLIVPVLVLEDLPVKDAVSRSTSLFHRTWGEQLAGSFGFGLLSGLLMLPAVGFFLLFVRVNIAIGLILGGVYALMMAAITSAVRGIYVTALYRYAVTGDTPPGFAADALTGPNPRPSFI